MPIYKGNEIAPERATAQAKLDHFIAYCETYWGLFRNDKNHPDRLDHALWTEWRLHGIREDRYPACINWLKWYATKRPQWQIGGSSWEDIQAILRSNGVLALLEHYEKHGKHNDNDR